MALMCKAVVEQRQAGRKLSSSAAIHPIPVVCWYVAIFRLIHPLSLWNIRISQIDFGQDVDVDLVAGVEYNVENWRESGKCQEGFRFRQ